MSSGTGLVLSSVLSFGLKPPSPTPQGVESGDFGEWFGESFGEGYLISYNLHRH